MLISALYWLKRSHPSQLHKLSGNERERELESMWVGLHESLVQREEWLAFQDLAESMLGNDELVRKCDLQTLLMVFTVHIRRKQMREGYFEGIVESGHLFTLLCQLRRLVSSGEPMDVRQAEQYQRFCGVVRDAVPGMLRVRGSALYGQAACLDPGPLLIMGTNPGTGPMPWMSTLEESLEFKAQNPRRHSYVDAFSGKTTILSTRLQWLVKQLGHDMRDVQAINLMFRATVNASELDYPNEAHACWPVHEWLIQKIRPKLLIVFGTSGPSPFNFLRKHLGWRQYTKRVYRTGHGSTKAYGVTGEIAGHELTVLGIPHPSIYEIRTPDLAAALRPESLIAGLNIP